MKPHSVLCVLWTLIVTADGCSMTSCTHVTPQSPVVELGTDLTAFCILNETCLEKQSCVVTSRELFWKVGTMVIPESQYTQVNDSVSSVTFQPTLTMHNILFCSMKMFGQTEITLHGIFFTLGYPPEKPKNLSCICYSGKTLTCSWESGRPTIIPTTYTLKQYWTLDTRTACVTEDKSSCTLHYPDFILHIDTTFLVEAVNDLGSAESSAIVFDIIDVVKPDPPEILTVTPVLQKTLKIDWKNPMDYLRYKLRYRPIDSPEWSEVPPEDLENTRSSFILQGLESYTTYNISMRCKPKKAGFWSEWSQEYTSTTSESAPSRGPELWRKIGKTDSEGKRTVKLMWKDLKSHANGKILGYNVTVRRGPEVINSFTVESRTCTITVPRESCEVLLTAYNSQGSSPPSSLIIPACTDQKVIQPADLNFKAFSQDGLLGVEWTPLGKALGYVIEWCNNSESMDCDVEWQREQSNVVRTFLRGDIKPFVYYLIRLNPLYRDGQERSSTVGTYLRQGAPEEGPIIQTKSTGKTWVTLTWKPIPLKKQNGVITNYTIKYGDNNSPSKVVTVGANVTEYMLKSLAARTAYSVIVTANTEKGSKAGLPLSFTTLQFDSGEVEAIVVSSCLGFLVSVLILCFLFCNKREQIKKHLWPSVPDPSKSNIAQWSPQTPSRHESKQHPFQDGPITDVSVVQITAGKEKSYSDQDLLSEDVIKKNTSEGLSSGIGGSSCLSSPQTSVSGSDGISCAQNTSSTVQYSTVIMGGYQGQTPMFSRSESTQPLLISEERPDEQQPQTPEEETQPPSQYFKQNFTQEDGGKNQEPPPPSAPIQEPAAATQVLHLAGFSHGHDNLNFTDSQSQEDAPSDEQKTYLPQGVRQGGYLPQ
ncbi:interleukin-6 receptor subunit beta isoform 1-T2 [Leptodactylus fuscus]|uniref:interleukin-6 receptor subunit beta n=1 Tax=Leptodactylus fuscus TaxID=238119 RepID=UPI003F4EDDDA